MHSRLFLSIAVIAAHFTFVSNPALTASCKTLKGEMVGFGEEWTRTEAQEALDREISAWQTKYSIEAKPRDRKVICKDYIQFLNEYECRAEAVVCR